MAKELDKFTLAYIECALWSSVDDDGNALDANYDSDDLARDTLRSMRQDCEDFQEANSTALTEAYEQPNYTAVQAGHDFWLTRNGHGAGFWDRGLGALGAKLTGAAKVYGSVDLTVSGRGKIHSV